MCSSWQTVIASMHLEFVQAAPQNHSENWIYFFHHLNRKFAIFQMKIIRGILTIIFALFSVKTARADRICH